MKMHPHKSSALVLFLTLAIPCSSHALVVSDDFSASVDYLTLSDFSGTIWDGFFTKSDEGGVVTQLNTTTAPGALFMEGTDGNFNHQGSDGAFLYVDGVAGDFVATVRVVGAVFGNFQEAGLAARVGDLSLAGAGGLGEDHVQSHARLNINTTGRDIRMRSIDSDDTTTTRTDTGLVEVDPIGTWLRLTRVGDDFFMSYSTDGISYIQNATFNRPDLSGLALQVGLFEASYGAGPNSATLDDFSLDYTPIPEPGSALLGILGLSVLAALRRR